jgi:proteasome beta subunit
MRQHTSSRVGRRYEQESFAGVPGSPQSGENADGGHGGHGGASYETGTTIVAVAAEDAAVMAADRRMSLGGRFTANKDVRKIEQVHPTAAVAISGSVGPAQGLLQSLRAEANLYEARRGEPMSVGALARTAGHAVRGHPVAPLLAGVDGSGPHVYELDGAGSVLEDSHAAGGSGMQVAYGVLERRFEPGLSVADARAAAVAAVEAASERDTASGNGVTVARVTDEAVTVEEPNDETPDTGDSAGEVA